MSRKKFNIVIFLVMASMAVFLARYLLPPFPAENILPADPVICLRIADAERLKEELHNCKAWQNLLAVDLDSLLSQSGVSDQALEKIRQMKGSFSSFIKHPAFSRIFEKEIIFALYWDRKKKNIDPEKKSAPGLVLISRVRPETKMIESLLRSVEKTREEISFTEHDHSGVKIISIVFPSGIRFSYTMIKDFFCAASDESLLKACIDAGKKKINRLSDSYSFTRTVSRLPDGYDLSFYGQADTCSLFAGNAGSFFPAQSGQAEAYSVNKFSRWLKNSGIIAWAWAVTLDREIETKAVITMNRHKNDPLLDQVSRTPPGENSSLGFIPAGVLWYEWRNFFDAPLLWERINAGRDQSDQGSPAERFIPEGCDPGKEVLPLLGKEFGIIFKDINTGLVPFPEICLFAEIKDKKSVISLFSDIMSSNNIRLKEKKYQDVSLRYFSFPFLSGFEPGFCVWKKYLFIFTGRSLLEKCIDTSLKNNASLAEDQLFLPVDKGVREKNNYSSFLRIGLLAERLQVFLKKGEEWASLACLQPEGQKKSLEYEMRSLKDQLPLLHADISSLKIAFSSRSEDLNGRGQGTAAAPNDKIKQLESELTEKKDQEKKILARIKELDQENREKTAEISSAKRKAFLFKLYSRELIMPFLEGIRQYQACSLRMVSDPELFQIYSVISRKIN